MQRPPLLVAVYLPTILLAFAQGLFLVTLPLHVVAEFDVSTALVGLAVAAAALGTLVTDVPAGALLGRLGLRPAMILGSALVALATLALAFAGSYQEVVAFRVAAGVGSALWGLSRHAYIAEAVPVAQRGRAISVFGGINRIGTFGGPAVGGGLGGAFGLEASFVLAGAFAVVGLILSILFIKPTAAPAVPLAARARWRLVGRLVRESGRDLSAAAVAQTFAQMIRAGRQLIIPLYGASIGLDAASIGLVMTVSALLDVSMFVPAGQLMDRFGRKAAAVPSFGVMAVGVGLIPLTSSYGELLAAAALIGLGNGLGSGTMMTLGADLAPPGATGEFLGLWRLVGDVGGVGGPLAVGLVADELGLEGSAVVIAGLGLAAALTLAFLVRETRQTPLDAT